jgi:excisionase family DNA binding protein
MAKGKKVLTPGDVAKICNVAHRTVQKWFDRGLLTGYRLPGSRDRRIPISELIDFMKTNNIPMTSPLITDFLDAEDKGSDSISAD